MYFPAWYRKRRELGLKATDIVLISAGRLEKNKNNSLVIKALGMLANPKVHFLVCGDGEEKSALEELTTSCGIKNQVHFLGNRTDIMELYEAADIFVLMSFREGLSRSIMEAMASGLPCIVSRIRGNVDLIEDGKGGYLVDPTDANAVKETLEKITNSDYRAIGQYNLTQIKKYSKDAVLLEFTAIYREELQ